MVEIIYDTPLKVPEGYETKPPSQRRFDHGFPPTLTLDEAINYMHDELMALEGMDKITVYTNYDHLNKERLRKKLSDDPGICIELRTGGRSYHILCDSWYMIEHNAYAIHLSLRAMKNIVKWGVADMATLLHGFGASSHVVDTRQAMSGDLPEWMHFFGLGPSATLDQVNSIYRQRAKEVAEDEHKLLELNQMVEQARKYFNG